MESELICHVATGIALRNSLFNIGGSGEAEGIHYI